MGNQISLVPTQIFSVEEYFTELQEYEFAEKLGSTRFLKIARARYKGSQVVVKVFPRIERSILQSYSEKIAQIHTALKGTPGTLTAPKSLITERSGILIRQYVWSCLSDRIHMRPFLSGVEKLWVVYQMLRALEDCHSKNIVHGDLKTENFLVTSWNWVLLTDFAVFKPTELLEDNPAVFSFFFASSRKRSCSIAPERFKEQLSPSDTEQPPLQPAMDIFSLGCVIAEMYLEGGQLFNIHNLISYKHGNYSPDQLVDQIETMDIRRMVRSMLEVDPQKRMSAEEYLQYYENTFPPHFPFLYSFIKIFSGPLFNSSDRKLHYIANKWTMIEETLSKTGNDSSGGYVIILSLITSCIRGIHRPSVKLQALTLLERLASFVPDDLVLDRILPHILFFTGDSAAQIRAQSIATLSNSLQKTTSVSTYQSIFPEYIFPCVNKLSLDPEPLVQRVFAEHIGLLAEAALSFLELSPNPPLNFDDELQELHSIVQIPVRQILTGEDKVARRILLEISITKLCVFFGLEKANDLILSHVITFLNDKDDWRLRGAFFESVVGVAAFVGWQSLKMLKPLLSQGLCDTEEFVVCKTLTSLISLTQLGLLEEGLLEELVRETVPLLCHPNLWLRYSTVRFISTASQQLHPADLYCKILPLLHPVLELPVHNPDNERALLQALPMPLPRQLLDFVVGSPHKDKLLRSFQKGSVEEGSEVGAVVEKLINLGMGDKQRRQIITLAGYIQKLSSSSGGTYDDNPGLVVDETKIKRLDYLDPDNIQQQIPSSPSLSDSTKSFEVAKEDAGGEDKGWDLDNSQRDDNLTKLLNRKKTEYFASRREERKGVGAPPGAWQPKGILVCQMNEHKAAINHVKVSTIHSILATASEDGNVKIWNTKKFDSRNIVISSRQTYSRPGQPIKGLAFYDKGDKVAVVTREGNLHEVGVKELKVCAAQTLDIESGDVVVDMDTLGSGDQQNLVVGTSNGNIVCVDMRVGSFVFKLSNKPQYGPVSAMCTDRSEHWICLGTRHGWLTCWDLRFRLPITSWQSDRTEPITCLSPSMACSSTINVGIKGYNEIGTWNMESGCKERALWYGPATTELSTPADQPNSGVHSVLPLSPDLLVTGGADYCVRLWNTRHESDSSVLSGPREIIGRQVYRKSIIRDVEVIQAEEDIAMSFTENKGLSQPSPAHHHAVTDLAFVKTTQPCLVSVDMGGIMKIWK